MGLDIQVIRHDGTAMVKVSGEIDGSTAGQAQAALLPLLEEHRSIVLDMSGVGYMSSAGLRMLLLVYRQVAAQDGKVAIAGLAEPIKDVMSITGFLKFFHLCNDADTALEEIEKG